MADRNVRVVLSLVANGFSAGMAQAQASTDRMIASVAKNDAAYKTLGTTATVAGAALLAGVGAAAKAAMDWESAFAGVRKTIDGTPEQISQIEGELRGMARTMASSHEEIAAVAEAAGQLGVATQDVSSFTRSMLMLGETTNMTADAAATSMAQFMNIMGSSPQIVGRLSATLVDLGNKGASTESQIMELSQRLAGAANQVGLTEAATMGFASAIASTGMNVEAGGTAMSKVFLKLQEAVEAGGEKLGLLSNVAGTDFATAFKKDAAGATTSFVDGLGRMQASGESVSGVLADLGIKGQYERDTLMRLAGATTAAGGSMDLLRSNLENANSAFGDGSALINEYAQRASTADSKVKVAWNNIKDAAITAGAATLPAIKGIAEGVSGLAQAFASMPAGAQQSAVTIAAIAGAALLGVGGLIKLASTAAEVGGALRTLGIDTDGIKGKLGGVPWGKVAAGAAIAVAGIAAVSAAMQAYTDAAMRHVATTEQVSSSFVELGKSGTGLAAVTSQVDKMNAALGAMGLEQVNGIGGLFKALGDNARSGTTGIKELTDGFLGMRSQAGVLRDEVTKMDSALSGMVSGGNLTGAQVAFRKLSDESVNAGESLEFTAGHFPLFKSQLETTAQALDVGGLSAKEYADWMRGDVPPAITEAVNAGGDLVDGLTSQQKAMTETASAAKLAAAANEQMATSAANAAKSAASVEGSQLSMEKAIRGAMEAAKANGKNLDITTEKGIANREALLGIATSTAAYVDQLGKTSASTETLQAAMQRGRDSYIQTAEAMKVPSDQAKIMADNAGLIPSEVATSVYTPGLPAAVTGIEGFVKTLFTVPGSTEAMIIAPGAVLSKEQADAVNVALRQVPGFTEAMLVAPGAVLSKEQADAVTRSLQTVPGVTTAQVVAPGAVLSKEQADQVNAALRQVPGYTAAMLVTPGAPLSREQADAVTRALQNVPKQTNANVATTADLSGARAAQTEIDRVKGKTVTVAVNFRAEGNSTAYRSATGSIMQASGGVLTPTGVGLVQAFASGGFHGSFRTAQPQIRAAGGPGVLWAEDGAGPWEAFISGNPAKRPRSRWILAQVAAMLGGQVMWDQARRYADGGFHSMAAPYVPPQSSSVTVTTTGQAISRADLDYMADRMAGIVLDGAQRSIQTARRSSAMAGRASA